MDHVPHRTSVTPTLDRAVRRLRRTRRAERVSLAVTFVMIATFVIAALDAWLVFPVWGRYAALGSMLGVLLIAGASLRLDRATRRASRDRAAVLLEREIGLDDAAILVGAQLERQTIGGPVGATLAARAAARSGAVARDAMRAQRVLRRRVVVRLGVVFVSVLAIVVVGALEPRFFGAPLARLLDPGGRLPSWSVAMVTLETESAPLIGDDVAFIAMLRGDDADNMWIELLSSNRADATVLDRIAMREWSDGAWRTMLRDLREPIVVLARAGRVESPPLRVTPIPRPRIEAATLTIRRAGAADRIMTIDPAAPPEQVAIDLGDTATLRVTTSLALQSDGDSTIIEGRSASRAVTPDSPGELAVSIRPIGPTGLAAREEAAVMLVVREQVGSVGSAAAPASGEQLAAGVEGGAPSPGEDSFDLEVLAGGEATGQPATGQGAQDAAPGEGGERGAGMAGPNVALRRDAPLPPRVDSAAPIGEDTLLAIERRALESGARAPGVGILRVPERYRDRVGAYFLRLLREEASLEMRDE